MIRQDNERESVLHLRTPMAPPALSPEKLRAARERAILSQEDLAKEAGLSRQTVARLEAGGPPPYPSTIRKLAKALRVKPQDLVEP